MMRLLRSFAFALVFVSLGAAVSTAALVAEYDVANSNAASSNVVNVASADANVSATQMTSFGALGSPFNNPASFCYLDWPTGAALDGTKYYEFSITPAGGWEVVYTDIDLAVASGGTGTGTFEIHASLDGFGASDITLAVQNFPVDATWYAYNLNIAALGTQSGTVTFRFYMYNIPGSGFAGLGVDPAFGNQGRNLAVNGTVRELPTPTDVTSWGRIKATYW